MWYYSCNAIILVESAWWLLMAWRLFGSRASATTMWMKAGPQISGAAKHNVYWIGWWLMFFLSNSQLSVTVQTCFALVFAIMSFYTRKITFEMSRGRGYPAKVHNCLGVSISISYWVNIFGSGQNGHHFQIHFLVWKLLYFDFNFTVICFPGSSRIWWLYRYTLGE